MPDARKFKLDKVPEGSRLQKYLRELPGVLKKSADEIFMYLSLMFDECLRFLKSGSHVENLPSIRLKLIPQHIHFVEEEKEADRIAKSIEIPKGSSTAFVIHNRYYAEICVDIERLIGLLEHGYLTFIMNLIETYVHEILHSGFPEKGEQEIHDMQCLLVGAFLGIELPAEAKNIKASDYYFEKAS